MEFLGPADTTRSVEPERLLPAAKAAADEAGVTRLADVTRLDRMGLPVWQAVRPMSRALSVHQGKGATHASAQLGALLEAVESHCAETFEGAGPTCRFEDLPARQRASHLSDFGRIRVQPPSADREYRWVPAENIVSGEPIYLPFELVSLDLTCAVPSPFDRCSNGIATGASRRDAVAAALHEFIERDAVSEWQSAGLLAAMDRTLDLDSAPFPWLSLWRERIERAGAYVQFYGVPTITGTPLFACEINDGGKDSALFRAVQGRGCHPLAEVALFKALAEALQARVTLIAGARDDQFPSEYAWRPTGVAMAFGLPLPPGMRGLAWSEIDRGPAGPDCLARVLANAGYPQVAVIELGSPSGLSVVRAFVCGLGSMSRRRRPPLP